MRLKDEKFYKTVRDFLDIYLIRHKGYSANTQKSYSRPAKMVMVNGKVVVEDGQLLGIDEEAVRVHASGLVDTMLKKAE